MCLNTSQVFKACQKFLPSNKVANNHGSKGSSMRRHLKFSVFKQKTELQATAVNIPCNSLFSTCSPETINCKPELNPTEMSRMVSAYFELQFPWQNCIMIVPLSKDNQNLLSMLAQGHCGLPPIYKQLCARNHIDSLSDPQEFRKKSKAILN